MSTTTLGLFLRHLALSEEVNRLAASSDRSLLAAYEAGRGQAAFTELMRRHGPMVLRTCRRVLGRGPDAEDAFQATFVLLARKAGELRREAAGPLSLGGWLHRVAYQTALNVLTGATRRKARERQAGAMALPAPDPATEATWNEVRPILDAELNALPEEPRRLLVACYLQGKTHAEAAAELGLPLGSVARRLDRARALLAGRLARRGITVSAALLAGLLAETASGAGVPAVLLVHSVEAAVAFTGSSNGAVSEAVARLVQAGLAKMAKGSFPLVLAGWVGLLGAGLLACQALGARPAKAPELSPQAAERPGPEEPAPAPTDRFGDPLPPGALARLGTIRLRPTGAGRPSVLFTADGRGVIVAGRSPADLWDLQTGKSVRQFGDREMLPEAVALSPDGRVLADRGGSSGGLRLWDLATGKLLVEGKGGPAGIVCLAFSPDGKMVASGGNDNKLRLWDVATGREQWVQSSAGGSISAIAFGPDGKTLIAVEAKAVSLWDATTGKPKPRRWESECPLSAAAFSPDGHTLAVVCDPPPEAKKRESVVCLVDVETLKEVRQLAPEQPGLLDAYQALALAPGGKILATANGSGELRLWDTATGKELRRFEGGRTFPGALAFSGDGKMLAGVDGGLVRLWETETGRKRSVVPGGHRRAVSSLAFTPDGGTLISNSWDGSVRMWDAATGVERRHIVPGGEGFEDYTLVGTAGAAVPDGKALVLVDLAWPIKGESFGVLIRQWDRDTGLERSRCFQKLKGKVPLSPVLSPDGKTVAGVPGGEGDPEEVHLWEPATGQLLARIPGGYPAFSPDGKLLATARGGRNEPGSITLWEAAISKELCSVPVSGGHVYRLEFSPTAGRWPR